MFDFEEIEDVAPAAAPAAAAKPAPALATGPGRPGEGASRSGEPPQQEPEAAEEPPLPGDPEVEAAEGRAVDELVQQRLQDLDFVDLADLKTMWLPCGSDPGVAEARLFCFFGAGKQAAQYRPWNESAIKNCPSIAVCPVELPGKGLHRGKTMGNAHEIAEELPGKGLHRGETMGNAHEIAEAFIKEVLDPITKDGRPWALFGFSIGARICYEIARRRPPVRLYASGCAAPHVGARKARDAAAAEPDPVRGDPTRFLQWVAAQGWGNEGLIARVLEHKEQEEDPERYLWKFAKPILDDLRVGETPLSDSDTVGTKLPLRPSCRIHLYDSQKDSSWPASLVANTWDRYAPGGKCRRQTYPSLSHEELCSISGEPLLKEILVDLHEVLFSGQ